MLASEEVASPEGLGILASMPEVRGVESGAQDEYGMAPAAPSGGVLSVGTAEAGRRGHLLRSPDEDADVVNDCKTAPRKHRYLDETTARAQAACLTERISIDSRRRGKKDRPSRVLAPYKCPDCPFWHLTTVKAEGTRRP